MDTPTAASYPDADAVIHACRSALIPHEGISALRTTTAANADTGIRMRFTHRGARRRASRALLSLGYVAYTDDPDEAILVTGWDVAALSARARLLEQTVNDLVTECEKVAPAAVDAYRVALNTPVFSPATAEQHVVMSFALPARDRARAASNPTNCCHTRQPIAAADLDNAPEAPRALLERIATAQTALRNLPWLYTGTVRGVLTLFRHYRTRHGRTDDDATAAAVRDVAAVRAACLAILAARIDSPHLPLHPDDDDPKIALEAQRLVDEGGPRMPVAERLVWLRIVNQISWDTYDLCRHCHLELHLRDDADQSWVDRWDESTCSDDRPHQPFLGAHHPRSA